MVQVIEQSSWPRASCYRYFKAFSNPFTCITSSVDCTLFHRYLSRQKIPAALWILYQAMQAANSLEELRYREQDDEVLLYDSIAVNTPIRKEDNNFTTVRLEYLDSWEEFRKEAGLIIDTAKAGNGEAFPAHTCQKDTIIVSVMPWLAFTGIQHGFGSDSAEGLPVVTIGKMTLQGDKWTLPVALAVHHGFADGFHIAQFTERFEAGLNRV